MFEYNEFNPMFEGAVHDTTDRDFLRSNPPATIKDIYDLIDIENLHHKIDVLFGDKGVYTVRFNDYDGVSATTNSLKEIQAWVVNYPKKPVELQEEEEEVKKIDESLRRNIFEAQERVFHNSNGDDYKVIDIKDEYALLARLPEGKGYYPYAVVWGLPNEDFGSWGQGHYFSTMEEANKDFAERTSGKTESTTRTFKKSVTEAYGQIDCAELEKFIKESISTLKTSGVTNCRYCLDDNLCVYVGWMETGIGNDYEICAKIAEKNDVYWADFDYLNMPFDSKSGEVYDTRACVSEDSASQVAAWLCKEYKSIIKALDNGTYIIRESKECDSKECKNGKCSHKDCKGKECEGICDKCRENAEMWFADHEKEANEIMGHYNKAIDALSLGQINDWLSDHKNTLAAIKKYCHSKKNVSESLYDDGTELSEDEYRFIDDFKLENSPEDGKRRLPFTFVLTSPDGITNSYDTNSRGYATMRVNNQIRFGGKGVVTDNTNGDMYIDGKWVDPRVSKVPKQQESLSVYLNEAAMSPEDTAESEKIRNNTKLYANNPYLTKRQQKLLSNPNVNQADMIRKSKERSQIGRFVYGNDELPKTQERERHYSNDVLNEPMSWASTQLYDRQQEMRDTQAEIAELERKIEELQFYYDELKNSDTRDIIDNAYSDFKEINDYKPNLPESKLRKISAVLAEAARNQRVAKEGEPEDIMSDEEYDELLKRDLRDEYYDSFDIEDRYSVSDNGEVVYTGPTEEEERERERKFEEFVSNFFDTRIAGRSRKNYQDASKLIDYLEETTNSNYGYFKLVYDRDEPDVARLIDNYVAEHPEYSKEGLIDGLSAMEDVGAYSDLYKDMNGVRPRNVVAMFFK